MAERIWVDDLSSDPFAEPDPYADGTSFGDYGLAAKSGAANIGSMIGAGLRAVGENPDEESKAYEATKYLGMAMQELFGNMRENALEDMSPDAARRIQATITDPNFWSLTSLSLKATQMAPEIAAAVIPSIVAPGALTAAAMVAATGGAISAASVVDEIYAMTDNETDEGLQAQAPAYRQLRESGLDEQTAREQYNEQLRGMKPYLLALVGAATNVVGPAGQIVRGMRGGAGAITSEVGEGLARRVGKGFAEGSAAEVVQSGAEAVATEQAAVEGGFQDEIDWGRVASQSAEGGVLGGILGGGIGAVAGRGGQEEPPAPAQAIPTVTSPTAPNQPGSAAPAPGAVAPSASGQSATPGVAPAATTAATTTPVTPQGNAGPKTVVVPNGTPDPAQSAALAAGKPKATQRTRASAPVASPTPTPAPAVTPEAPVASMPDTAPVQQAPVRGPEISPEIVQTPPPVSPAPEPAQARPEPTVAQPASIQTTTPEQPQTVQPVETVRPVEPEQTGPRILEDRTQAPVASWNDRIATNLREAEQPVAEEAPRGRNRTQAELEQRTKTNEGAVSIAQKYSPAPGEAGLLSKKPQEKQAARVIILNRAKAMVDEAKALGITIPKAVRDSANTEQNYNSETMLLVEARRLATVATPKQADYERFQRREFDIRSGAAELAKAERRAEGDAAMRQSVETQVDDAAEVSDADTPESILERAEEEGLVSRGRTDIPKAVAAVLDRAAKGDTEFKPEVAGASRSKPKVETVKRRVIKKPEVTTKVTEAPKPTAKPAVTPKVAELKARVEKARSETNTNPTQAQALTGNYAKGRVSVSGMEVAIENPKGSVRSNKDPNGPKWSVKLRTDYGYLVGTRGVDGDPIDVYLGPDLDATYVYVIDQRDLDTMSFDEHKVMMGFRDQVAAINAYDKAFSDGRGKERIGDFRRMTIAEFKEWANSRPKDEAGLSDAEVMDIRSFNIGEMISGAVRKITGIKAGNGMVTDPISGNSARVVSSHKAGRVIEELDLSHLSGLERVISAAARRTLASVVPDVDVHFVNAADVPHLLGTSDERTKSYFGWYSKARNGEEAIFINVDAVNNPTDLAHTVLHEAVHAATASAIDANIDGADALVFDVMQAIRDIRDTDYARGRGNWQYSYDDLRNIRYGMSSTKEFVAEAFSNPRFQEVLSRMPAPEALVQKLGLDRRTTPTMWNALITAIRRILGMPKNSYTMLEAAIRVTEISMKPRIAEAEFGQSFLVGNTAPMRSMLKGVTDRFLKSQPMNDMNGYPHLARFRTMDSLARESDRYFGGNNPIRKLANYMEGRRQRAQQHVSRAEPIVQNLYDMQRKYKGVLGQDGMSVWDNFTALLNDETMAGVFADRPLSDQKHISKKGARDAQKRAAHAELARAWSLLPDDLKKARVEAMEYFRNEQNNMSLALIRNRIVAMFDTPDPDGLAQRIHEKKATEADKALLGDVYDTIAAAGALSKIDGPYFPLMRRGNYVVSATLEVTKPKNAKELASNEFEFTSADDAETFAEAQNMRTTVRTVYVDKTTGSEFGETNGNKVRISANDMNAEARYRVVVQNRTMEMFDTMSEARAYSAALRAKGIDAGDAVPRRFDGYGNQMDAMSTQLQRMMQSIERRADERGFTPEQKDTLLRSAGELSMSLLGATRIQSRSLPRTYVQGASKDIIRNTHDYAVATGNYQAKLEFAPKVDVALAEAKDATQKNRSDGLNAGRTAMLNEVSARLMMQDPASQSGGWNGLVNRILTMSFIDKLASPSYSFINATQPMMISAPYLAGQYGPGTAYKAMMKAYNDIGSMQVIKDAFKDTVAKATRGDAAPHNNPVSLIRARLKDKGEQAFLDAMVEVGSLDVDATLELGKLTRERKGVVGGLDTGIGYLEGIARQFPKYVEAMNRSVVGLAAYRLEMQRSGDVAKATQFAQDTINLTQFNYSSSNAAPYMNHPVLRLVFQFKKYGIGMYQFMGEMVTLAVRNENPGDRARAIKSLSYTIGMHALIAGAMGLPTEPIKMIVTTANGLGFTDWSWSDVEAAQRELSADLFGKDFGEIVSRGLPRAIGVDMSSRMGIDTLMGPFGEPRSNEAQDWKAYAWDTIGGAPGGLITDWAKGLNSLIEGDIVRAAERLVPLKVVADGIKAYRTATEGSVSEKTGKQVMSPYTMTEAAIRTVGFQPAREAESFERSNMFYRNRDALTDKRTEFQREWSEANGAARGRIWRDIQKWNRTQPRDARISLSDLRDYQKRLKDDMKKRKEGILATKRDQQFLDRADRTFNYLP